MSFETLGLEPELLRAVAEKGYTTPTPIQLKAIPAVLSGRDVLAGAQTGTGKTAGFVLPLLQKLGAPEGRLPRVLVLTPTRELAAQIAENVRDYGKHKKLRPLVIFGGVGERPQIDGLRAGCDILIATPGRLIDLVEQGYGDLSAVRHLVLDEADRMLDMGFIPAIKRILKMLPAQRQNLMFSATYSDDIRVLAERMLRDPVAVEVAARNTTADRVEQVAYRIAKDQKRHLLVHLFKHGVAGEGAWEQVLVFTRTKHGANRLAEQLDAAGIRATAIHGNKSQNARIKALADFKDGKTTALVATEVASRGLDIKELPHVVNYELPNVPEDYVHRIGRTARAGSTGAAVSLVAPDEASLLREIERTMKRSIPFVTLPAYEQAPTAAASRNSEYGYVDPRSAQQPRPAQGSRGGQGGHGGRGHSQGHRGGGGGGGGARRDESRPNQARAPQGGGQRSGGAAGHAGGTRSFGSARGGVSRRNASRGSRVG
jgi:ATP-dependent RNA helicase RhlE